MGIWQAKPGREDAFAAAWWELAEWTGREFLGVEKTNGTLLRDRDHPGRFVSLGPWDSLDQIAAWRAHPGFRKRVTRRTTSWRAFTPAVLDPVPPWRKSVHVEAPGRFNAEVRNFPAIHRAAGDIGRPDV